MARVKSKPKRRSSSTTFYKGRGKTRYGRVRNTRRRRSGNSAITAALAVRVPRNKLTPFPGLVIKRHRYIETITMPAGAAAGLSSSYTFSANGIYDCNITGVGHQPMFRDEMAANYAAYTVLESYITWLIPNSNTSLTCYGNYTDDAAFSTAPGIDVIAEQHGASPHMVTNNKTSPLALRGKFIAKNWFKTTISGIMADDHQKVLVTENCPLPVYFHLWKYPMDSTATTPSIYVRVIVNYIVAWRDPKVNLGS